MFSRISQIKEHLYLTSARGATEKNIRLQGITLVINCTLEIPDFKAEDLKCIRVPVEDSKSANLAAHFDSVSDLIESEKNKGGSTLIHCVAGVSRSATLCIAYLIKCYEMTLKDAYQLVKSKRFVIRPNVAFFRQLIDYEHRIHGKTTVNMVESPVGVIPDVYEEGTKMIWIPLNLEKT